MKCRNGFVSNSSSSSFVLLKEMLSPAQINKIQNHIYFGNRLHMDWASDDNAWDVFDEDDVIKVSTFMDNFDMRKFLDLIGVSNAIIKEDY